MSEHEEPQTVNTEIVAEASPRQPDAVQIFDTTLRDGTQLEGVSVTVDDKLRIAEQLDHLGVHFIEGGWPGSNEKDTEFFQRAPAELSLKTSTLVAFGSTRRPKGKVDDDETLRNLVKANTSAACIVGKCWDYHVTEALKVSLDEGVAMVRDSIEFLHHAGLRVMLDAEHFFDGYKHNPEYSLRVLEAAATKGAEVLVLCDTNGGSLPNDVERIVSEVYDYFDGDVGIGVHLHDDTGCGVANALAGVRGGATQVQGTINGIGERTGNCNLTTIIPNLTLKMGVATIPPENLERLTAVSHHVAELVNVNLNPQAAYVGTSAFAHKAGLHHSAIARRPDVYEHIDPNLVGNGTRFIVSELAGKSTLEMKAKEIGLEMGGNELNAVVSQLKELEHQGYHFEAADGSLELLMREANGWTQSFFTVESFRVIVDHRPAANAAETGSEVVTEATIKVLVDGERIIATAEGNGPVNALDMALRQAIGRRYPAFERLHLTDFKVRVLDTSKATGAVTRVLIDSTNGDRSWSTIGVSENMIEAAWEALLDSIVYGLLHTPEDADKGAGWDDRAAFDAAPTALVVFDASGVVHANPEACVLLDADASELIGGGLAARFDQTSSTLLAAGVRDALDPDRPQPIVADRAGGDAEIDPGALVLRREHDPGRYLVVRLGVANGGRVVGSIADVSGYFHAMMLLAYSANTTMVLDPSADILWGPVGRYAAQEFNSPWYGRGEANPLGWLHPEDMGRVLQAFADVLDNPGVVHEITVRTRHVILEDQWGTAMIRAINLIDDPLIGGVLVQTHAEGEENKVSLGRTTGSFQSIAEAAPIGIILSDHLGRPLYWNTVARELFALGPIDRSDGATQADVDFPSLVQGEQVVELRELLAAALEGEQGTVTALFVLPSGKRWLSVTVAPQLNDVDEPMGWLATLQDITRERDIQHELEATQERLIHLALHDPLTGLANRRMFADQLARGMARASRDHQQVALLFCDLDGFKPVNDTLGHDIGDRVLEEVATRLTSALRTNDLAARLGGDEFVVLVEGFADVTEVEVVARRLVDVLAEPIAVPIAPPDVPDAVTIGVSIGIAVARDEDTPDSLLSRADDLMYQAKAAGRGRFVLDAS